MSETTELWMTLSQAREELPLGARPRKETVTRWAVRGCFGIRLRSRRIGKRLYTTALAVQEFLAAVEAATSPGSKSPTV